MLDRSRPLFSFVRCHRVKCEKYLRQQEAHGDRSSPTAALRPGASPGVSLFWSRFGSETCHYVDDLRAHLKESGARVRGGAAISLHLLIGVSAEWIQETGGIHDGENSRVRKLFEEARVFAEKHFGGVYAMRMDLDERGSGVVDVFTAPVHMRSGRPRKDGSRGKDVCEVSVKSALVGLQRSAGGGKQFAALQTLWAHHAATRMDRRIVRGVPRAVTGRQHLSVAEYRESVEAEKSWKAEVKGQRQTILNSFALIAKRDEETEAKQAQLDRSQRALDDLGSSLGLKRGEVAKRVSAIEGWERDLHVREQALELTRREVIESAVRKEEQRRAEHEAAQHRLAEAEQTAWSATELAGIQQRRAVEMSAEADAREEELKVRARKQQLAEDKFSRQAQELSARSAKVLIEETRIEAKAASMRCEEEGLRVRTNEIAVREQNVERIGRIIVENESARGIAHRQRQDRLMAAEAAAIMREGEAIEAGKNNRQAQVVVLQQVAASKAEREALVRDRDLVAREKSDLVKRTAAIDARDASSRLRGETVAERERAHAVKVSALETGLMEIAAGHINGPVDIVRRADLAPAADLLRTIGSVMAARVKQVMVDYAQRREALAAEQQKVNATVAAAIEREKAATEAEAKYRTAAKDLVPELRRLRRIRDWGLILAKYVDHPPLRLISTRLNAALDGLAAELNIGRDGKGRE